MQSIKYDPEREIEDKWRKIPYEQREVAAQFIFLQLKKAIGRKGVSFRKLIYDYLGFDTKSYAPLYYAGGMDITNFIIDGSEDNGNAQS